MTDARRSNRQMGKHQPREPRRETQFDSGRGHEPAKQLQTSDLLGLYRPDIADLLDQVGAPAFRTGQILEHLLRRPGQSLETASNLPLDIRRPLEALGASTLTQAGSVSSDDGTTKLLLKTADGLAIETVVMRYRDRVTACISSQVGCPVGCAFCATGALGLARNLSAAEIVDQVRMAAVIAEQEQRRLSNLVYMGMGEPLLNLQAVIDSIRIVSDARGMNLSHRGISVSTVGIPAGIIRLGRAEPQINLAISLHAADDRIRAQLVPDRFRHPLATVLESAWEHFEITRRKLLIEYVLIGGVNDLPEHARRLAGLLRGHVVVVNLLAWNPVSPSPVTCDALDSRRSPRTPVGVRESREKTPRGHQEFRAPTPEAVAAFRHILASVNIEVVLRQSKGSRIQAACGQLAARERSYRGK